MSRRRRPQQTALSVLTEHADHGSGYARSRGRWHALVALAAGDNVELVEIVDHTRPEVRGATTRVARRVDPLLCLLDIRHDGPGRAQFLAAEQLRKDSAMAEGRSPTSHYETAVATSGTPDGPTHRALAAQARVRLAWRAIRGPHNDALVADVVRLAVLGMQPLARISEHHGWHDKGRRARRLLDAGLERLAEHYGLVARAA